MKLSDFDLFIQVAQRGSFADAAKATRQDPSAVSRHIARLERETGLKLFHRSTRQLALTQSGKLLFDRLQAPLDEVHHLLDEARDAQAEPSGTLRVSASVAFAERWLVPRLASFQERFRAIHIDLAVTDQHVDLIADNIDLAIRLGPQIEGRWVATRLLRTHYRAVASPAYLAQAGRPSTPGDLTNHACLTFSLPGLGSRWQFRHANEQAETIHVDSRYTISNALVMRRAALEAAGIALLADWTIDDDVRRGDLIDLWPSRAATASTFDTGAWLVFAERAYMPTKTRVLIDFLKGEARQNRTS